jgi:hypothetical protein
MNRTEFEQDLQGFFHNEAKKVKHPEGWWNNVVSSATGEKPEYTAPKAGFFRRKLFLVPLALIVALIVTGGTVYGYSSFLKSGVEGMVPSVENGETGEVISLAQQYDLSRTIDGVTAKLEYAYTDMNVAIVGVSVEGSDRNSSFRLYMQDGRELDGSFATATERGEWVWSFEMPAIEGNPSSLSLYMEILVSEDSELFIFDFEAPYYGGKVVNVGQTVEAAGVKVELESLLISPSETRAILYITPQTDGRGSYAMALMTIQIPDGSEIKSNGGSGNSLKEPLYNKYFNIDLTSQSGEWVITVTELVYPPVSTSNAAMQTFAAEDTVHLIGPWVFTVQVE